jgi:hypothetical protein
LRHVVAREVVLGDHVWTCTLVHVMMGILHHDLVSLCLIEALHRYIYHPLEHFVDLGCLLTMFEGSDLVIGFLTNVIYAKTIGLHKYGREMIQLLKLRRLILIHPKCLGREARKA